MSVSPNIHLYFSVGIIHLSLLSCHQCCPTQTQKYSSTQGSTSPEAKMDFSPAVSWHNILTGGTKSVLSDEHKLYLTAVEDCGLNSYCAENFFLA